MKKITNLLVVASLALAGAVMAQQPTPSEEQSPGKKPKSEKKAPAEVKPAQTRAPKTEAPKTEAPAVKEKPEAAAPKESAAPKTEAPATTKPDRKTSRKQAPAATPEAKAPTTSTEQPATSATPDATKKQSRKDKKSKEPAASASTTPATATTSVTPAPTRPSRKPATSTTTATASPAATTPATATSPAASAAGTTTTASTTPAAGGTPATTATPATGATMTPSAAGTAATTASPSASTTTTTTAAAKKPDPAKVQQIRQQHTTFRAQPRPDRAPPVTFSANFRLPGVERWQGPQYEVYRSYRPERHDRTWYTSRYQRVELIAGGYYYFNNGYWYPAWGYDPGHEYYAYDAPIYVGKRAVPPDQVIADVQAVLQEMGYYKGEVDGLIGPLTRQALTAYQNDQGLVATAVIDEPTLDSLGMS